MPDVDRDTGEDTSSMSSSCTRSTYSRATTATGVSKKDARSNHSVGVDNVAFVVAMDEVDLEKNM